MRRSAPSGPASTSSPINERVLQRLQGCNYDHAGQAVDKADHRRENEAEQFTSRRFSIGCYSSTSSAGKAGCKFNGDSDYLNALWKDYQANSSQSNFYTDRLTALFFAGLNNPQALNLMRDNPALCALIGEPPFLNGGLFEPTPVRRSCCQRRLHRAQDEAVEPLLTDLFNRYNFTVMEATPLDTEVAVDPEMLGKLFEETVNERHK